MTSTQIKPLLLLDTCHRESVIRYAMEKCAIQLENQQAQLDTLLAYRAECEIEIRTIRLGCDSAAHIREYQLHILRLEQEIAIDRTRLEISQQKLAQYQQRLRLIRGDNQLNEIKAAIKSLELRLQQSASRSICCLNSLTMKSNHALISNQYQHQNTPCRVNDDVKK